jgi:hypothetical protein
MAIDFMVMPMSRYISGDFVTPAMRASWGQGIPYSIIGPDGPRELPPGLPFGGADAPRRRVQIVDMIVDDLKALPSDIAENPWNERSAAGPCFHRVDPESYKALLEHFAEPLSRRFGLLRAPKRAHSGASLFLPCDFESPFDMTSPFERLSGAVAGALRELEQRSHPADAESAAETLRDGLRDAERLRLPLIVDW